VALITATGLDPRKVIPIQERNRFLDGVERLGNALPDPALIFVGLIAVLMALSAFGAAAGWSAVNPITGETLNVMSLLSEESIQLLITEFPRTYAGFAPLGAVLTIMLGAGVADRSGLFATLVRAGLSAMPKHALVPVVMLTVNSSVPSFLSQAVNLSQKRVEWFSRVAQLRSWVIARGILTANRKHRGVLARHLA
jgi:p-aminobenzoyl-glutamate transporter AbgT